MLELGRVDFEVTLTLCRLQWGSCAPCYVPARSNSDGGSCSPRLFSTPLFQHQSSQDSTSLSKTPLSFILSSQDRCLLSLPLDAKFTPWYYYKKKKGKSTEVTLFHLDFCSSSSSGKTSKEFRDLTVSVIVFLLWYFRDTGCFWSCFCERSARKTHERFVLAPCADARLLAFCLRATQGTWLKI